MAGVTKNGTSAPSRYQPQHSHERFMADCTQTLNDMFGSIAPPAWLKIVKKIVATSEKQSHWRGGRSPSRVGVSLTVVMVEVARFMEVSSKATMTERTKCGEPSGRTRCLVA